MPSRPIAARSVLRRPDGVRHGGAASTDNKGVAEDYWTLGTSTSQAQQVEVRAVLPTGEKQVYGVFTATALAGPPKLIAIQAGNNQTRLPSTTVVIPPAVLVSDQYGNPVPNLGVAFAVASGGGSVAGGSPTTNTSGIASVGSWTLGSARGSNRLTATASGSGIAGNPVTFSATGICASACWSAVASMTTARTSLGTAAISGILYAVGGYNNSNYFLTTVEAYSPLTDAWTTKAPMPTGRQFVGVAALNGILYAVGGNRAPSGPLNTVEAYDPTVDAWTTKAPMLSQHGDSPGVAIINGILYVVGGTLPNSSATATLEAYDPATDTWTTKAPMPTALSNLGAAVINGILYVVGGSTCGCLQGIVPTVEAYDPATNMWTTKAPLPTGRGEIGVGVVNGILYAVGGITGGGNFVGTVEAYDPVSNTWMTTQPMSTARYGPGVAAMHGFLYAVGGFDGNIILNSVEAYPP